MARGELVAAVPHLAGPTEVVMMGESFERMRVHLVDTIADAGGRARRAGGQRGNARTAELTHTLAELKRTQAALIQGERLASIGELTAGVAHEINNPSTPSPAPRCRWPSSLPELREVLDAYRLAEADLPPARRQGAGGAARLDSQCLCSTTSPASRR